MRILALVMTAALLVSACEYSEIDGIGTRTADEEHPPQSDTINRWS